MNDQALRAKAKDLILQAEGNAIIQHALPELRKRREEIVDALLDLIKRREVAALQEVRDKIAKNPYGKWPYTDIDTHEDAPSPLEIIDQSISKLKKEQT